MPEIRHFVDFAVPGSGVPRRPVSCSPAGVTSGKDDPEPEALRSALDNCREKLEETKEELAETKGENEQLRRSAELFGTLAERLNLELHERRQVGERRSEPRETPDRRA